MIKETLWSRRKPKETFLEDREGNKTMENAIVFVIKSGSVYVTAMIVAENAMIALEIEIAMIVSEIANVVEIVNETVIVVEIENGIGIGSGIGIEVIDVVNVRTTGHESSMVKEMVQEMLLGMAREGGAGLNHWRKNLYPTRQSQY